MRDVAEGSDKLLLSSYTPDSQSPMSIAEIQRALKAAGFFPGGTVDGICGYRTRSAMRLFQEYVRSVEKRSCVPDGRFGPLSQQHLRRWIDQRAVIEWAPTIERWRAGTLERTEYIEWLSLLGAVKDHYASNPGRMLQLVNAFPSPSDTRRVAQWDFSSTDNIHLVGIRRDEKSNKFDDIFVLLIKGLVFKFQGSTEPGASDNPAGVPFLVQGQHDYQFGWHKKQYLALRPLHLDKGVLVVRSKDMRLDEADLNKGLEANASINVHWGGKGMKFDVKNWSEGCQVINGTVVHRSEQRADRLLNLRRHQQWRGGEQSGKDPRRLQRARRPGDVAGERSADERRQVHAARRAGPGPGPAGQGAPRGRASQSRTISRVSQRRRATADFVGTSAARTMPKRAHNDFPKGSRSAEVERWASA